MVCLRSRNSEATAERSQSIALVDLPDIHGEELEYLLSLVRRELHGHSVSPVLLLLLLLAMGKLLLLASLFFCTADLLALPLTFL